MPDFPQNPYLIYGIAKNANASLIITAKNLSTAEAQTAIIEPGDKSYNVDCANFTSGYNDGDLIIVSASGFASKSIAIDLTDFPDGKNVDLSKLVKPVFSHRVGLRIISA